MAKEYEFKFAAETAGREGLDGKFDLETGQWLVTADMEPYLLEAKLEREKLELMRARGELTGYRRFAVIPDICAVYIKENYGIDAFAPDFMHDKDKMAKFKKIFQDLYPALVIST